MGKQRNFLSRHDRKRTDSADKNERLQKKRWEERERLSHEINVEVEHREIDVEVHENDKEMRNVEELVNENIENTNVEENIEEPINENIENTNFQENIDIDLTGESIGLKEHCIQL